jgi:hypothetical protein
MGFLSRFLERRNWRRRARAYLRVLQREPSDPDVAWLAQLEPRNDVDHARWELRYARLALGQIEAERDSLDDRAPAVVAHELFASLAADPRIAAGMLETAERQLNVRLRRYREAVARRSDSEPLARRMGRELLAFTHGDTPRDPATMERAGEILRRYTTEFNLALQDVFGRAALPEDVRPSEVSAA